MIVPPQPTEAALRLAHYRRLQAAARSMTASQVEAAVWAMGGDPEWTADALANHFDPYIERAAAKVADEEREEQRHQAALDRLREAI